MAASLSKASDRQRSATTGNDPKSPPPSYSKVASGSSDSAIRPRNKHGGSYDYSIVERLEEGDDSHNIVGTTALEPREGQRVLKQPSTTPSKPYSHHASNTKPSATSREMAGSSGHKDYSLSFPTPSVTLLPLPHSATGQHGGESERSTRAQQRKRHRDFLSQDVIGDREMMHLYSSGPSVHHALSLQDEMTSHRRGPTALQPRGVQAETRFNHEEMVPILEVAEHAARNIYSTPQELLSQESDTDESLQLQPLEQAPRTQVQPTADQDSGGTQERYYPVFFSPESGRLFMHAEGCYHVLPDQLNNPTTLVHSQPQHYPTLSPRDVSGRQTSSSTYDLPVPHDYYHCSIVMMLLFILCLDIPAVLLCSIPALWFAKKAMQAKHSGDFARTLSLGTRALCFNIIGGLLHVLFLCAIVFTPILLHFVFEVL